MLILSVIFIDNESYQSSHALQCKLKWELKFDVKNIVQRRFSIRLFENDLST